MFILFFFHVLKMIFTFNVSIVIIPHICIIICFFMFLSSFYASGLYCRLVPHVGCVILVRFLLSY